MSGDIRNLAAQHGYRLTHVRIYGGYRFYLWDNDGQLAADGRSFDEPELLEYLVAPADSKQRVKRRV